MSRKPIGERAMTSLERVHRSRQKRRARLREVVERMAKEGAWSGLVVADADAFMKACEPVSEGQNFAAPKSR